jgi:hypothetical protein
MFLSRHNFGHKKRYRLEGAARQVEILVSLKNKVKIIQQTLDSNFSTNYKLLVVTSTSVKILSSLGIVDRPNQPTEIRVKKKQQDCNIQSCCF